MTTPAIPAGGVVAVVRMGSSTLPVEADVVTPEVASIAATPPAPVGAAKSPAAFLQAFRADLAARQGGAAQLFADLPAALNAPDLPAATKAAAMRVLALLTPTTEPLSAASLRQAVAQSGLFLEARLAGDRKSDAPPADLKAALLSLRARLDGGAAPAARAPTVPPPAPGGDLVAQAARAPSLPAGATADAISGQLRGEVDQALARQTLHQLASLPGGPAAHWMFELPLATAQGAVMVPFEVDRDGGGAAMGGSAAAWQARFSIDLGPLGPVHVHLRLDGDRTAATVWAERDDTYDLLRRQGAEEAAHLPADIVFHPGAPRVTPPPAGQFVDETS